MRHRRAREAISSTTELVLLMPAVLLAVMVSVQAALFFHAQQVVEAAAQEALDTAQGEAGTADLGDGAAEARRHRPVLDGSPKDVREHEDIQEFYLGGADSEEEGFANLKQYKRKRRWWG